LRGEAGAGRSLPLGFLKSGGIKIFRWETLKKPAGLDMNDSKGRLRAPLGLFEKRLAELEELLL